MNKFIPFELNGWMVLMLFVVLVIIFGYLFIYAEKSYQQNLHSLADKYNLKFTEDEAVFKEMTQLVEATDYISQLGVPKYQFVVSQTEKVFEIREETNRTAQYYRVYWAEVKLPDIVIKREPKILNKGGLDFPEFPDLKITAQDEKAARETMAKLKTWLQNTEFYGSIEIHNNNFFLVDNGYPYGLKGYEQLLQYGREIVNKL